ncbi:MAG: fibronectin type III domain-containing protein [Terriglobales bacterium]
MRASSKSAKASMIVLGVFTLVVAWIIFQLSTHRHTGILRTLAQAKHRLSEMSASTNVQQRRVSAPAGLQHSVNLSWKASPSAVVGYNVYRRGASGVVKINSEPVPGTSYVDRTVQPGQTYFYVSKAVNARGTESTPSNEVRADIPSP